MITDSNQANFVRLSGCGLQEVSNDPSHPFFHKHKDSVSLPVKCNEKSPGSSWIRFQPVKIIPIFT
jgi:hypothetical protein